MGKCVDHPTGIRLMAMMLDCLGVNLGDTVATFLGEGNWRPYRKSMVDRWEVAGWNKESN
ncbi:MAG: hypothetical protein KGS61_18430 [Verrucomicrobia bacterium]|nr:hypothetical protein [Verrucomicrobiota bacterium]